MHTITATNGAGTTTPLAVEGYSLSLESRSHFHDTLDGGIGFAYVPPRPGSGPITLVYSSRAAAYAALSLHSLSPLFSWVSEDVPEASMTYAVDGSVSITPGDSGLWRVSVDCRVVS